MKKRAMVLLLILALLLVWCAALIAADLWTKSRRERR